MTDFKQMSSMALTVGLIFACAVAQADATEICFRSNASVSGSTVMLRDVATVSGADAEAVKRLEQTVLGPAPAPGRSTRLDFDEMRSRLEATGISTADATFSGAAVVVVSCTKPVVPIVRQSKRKTRVNVSQTQVRRAEKLMTQSVRQSLRARTREAGNLFLDVIVDPTDVPIILASATEGFELGAVDPKNANSQSVQVRTQDSQGRAVKFQIQCVVSEKPRVPVLNRSVSGGEVIREDDLAWKQVDNTEGVLAKIEDIVGKEAKKGLHADEPLRADDVRTIPLVRSNDIVTGIWKKAGIRISGQFKSKSDGGKGDVITLVQLTGHEQVLARVTDVHEAEIVTGDVVRPAKGDGEDQEEEVAPAPVRTVAHHTPKKRKQRKPDVVNATATDQGDTAQNATASDNAIKTSRDEASDSSSR
ncbi:MAG TPA: flagellar basal body P-ring formation chaperone FlgA [Planctomycetaceae bacterium]|jgi:flagella basal body P-ring formation protein FlgA|nr:flagellar basal body P-ring formation chaperone FlgA [Planctomycetaceae bacterium]